MTEPTQEQAQAVLSSHIEMLREVAETISLSRDFYAHVAMKQMKFPEEHAIALAQAAHDLLLKVAEELEAKGPSAKLQVERVGPTH
jgi:hypothetical protein